MSERRDFIKKSALGTAAMVVGGMGFSAKSYASIIGANDRINIGLVGIRNQGLVHVNAWCDLMDSHNVRLTTLCDTDEQFFASRSQIVVEKTGIKPKTEWDIQKVLADKDIDAVSIVTPNHWHALATIWACQAGKHVYVEKPASHNIWEGRKMVEAARKYDRRVQVGHQNRSFSNVREAIKFLHEGGIGEVYMARGLCYKQRDSFGIAEEGEIPATLHYDRWLGPAPYRPYKEKRGHYNWHWYWDTGNGDTGNQGPHQFDIARWGLNKNEHPVSVYSTGGIYGFNKGESSGKTAGYEVYGGVKAYDQDKTSQESPNTQSAIFKYGDGKMLEFETRGRYTNGEGKLGIEIGNIFYGSDGYLEINGGTWKAFREGEEKPFAGSQGENEGSPFINFIEAMRSGRNETLNCDINEGFYSAVLPLMANISYRLGGRQLNFMDQYEKFDNDPAANIQLLGNYRPPYIVPAVV